MQRLEIETPEHVVLDLEVAGVGSRALAALIDTVILAGGTLACLLAVTVLGFLGLPLGFAPWVGAMMIVLFAGGWFFYFLFFEGFRRGRTPGKRITGIRVVSDSGHAITAGAAALRNLLRLADFLPPPYLTGMVLAALHPRGKRLGDLVAGTVVVHDRPAAAPIPRADGASSAAAADGVAAAPALTDADFLLLTRFAHRVGELPPSAAEGLAQRVASRLGTGPAADTSLVDHLLALYGEEQARRRGGLGAAGGDSRALRFVERKIGRWRDFHAIAERAASRGLDSFGAAELPDFAARYREVAADLARARTYRADASTLGYLERLVAAGHNALYREEPRHWGHLWSILMRECPAAVLQSARAVLLAAALFLVPAAAGYLMLRERPSLAAEVLPDVLRQRAKAGITRRAEGRKYFTADRDERPIVASGIISNNVRVAIMCFAGGIFFGVGSLVLLAFNGLLIGSAAGHFANMGVLDYLFEFTVGHGQLELFAIWVAGAAGFLLGRAVLAPGTFHRADALVLTGRTALRMLGASVVCLIVAGIIEGFVSAGGWGLAPRVWAAGASLLFLALYLANGYDARKISRIRMASFSTSRNVD